jgi:quercetin dioxygenase-like cupin family protein
VQPRREQVDRRSELCEAGRQLRGGLLEAVVGEQVPDVEVGELVAGAARDRALDLERTEAPIRFRQVEQPRQERRLSLEARRQRLDPLPPPSTTPEFYPSRLAPMEIYNLNGDEWNLETEHEDYVFKDCWVGARIGAELIGGSMYEVAPGKKQGPYHTHHGNEEWAIVIRGRPTLRTPEGERELREGDVVCFPRGKAGAHQVINRTSPCGCWCSRRC